MDKADAIDKVLRLSVGEGIYEGLLSEDELAVLPMLIEHGLVERRYTGVAAWLGLSKIVRVKGRTS